MEYKLLADGEIKISKINDTDEFATTDNAMETLQLSAAEITDIYKILASILHQGNVKFTTDGKGQASVNDVDAADHACFLLGLNSDELTKNLCTPKILVGNEWVTKAQTPVQSNNANVALLKSSYERLFKWLVKIVNKPANTDHLRRFFVGIFDFPGFLITQENSFEQLCINYTNDVLQQYFNHQMFTTEQELYAKENLQWEYIDFGFQNSDAVDLVEKPTGIFALLEEECLFPQSSDMTFKDKIFQLGV